MRSSCLSVTQRQGTVDDTPAAYSGGPGFQSGCGDLLKFVVHFLSSYWEMLR